MKDRVVQYPSRYRLTPVSGQEGVFDITAVPGTITEAGTPLNKASLLSGTVEERLDLTGEPTVSDAFLAIPKSFIEWSKIGERTLNDAPAVPSSTYSRDFGTMADLTEYEFVMQAFYGTLRVSRWTQTSSMGYLGIEIRGVGPGPDGSGQPPFILEGQNKETYSTELDISRDNCIVSLSERARVTCKAAYNPPEYMFVSFANMSGTGRSEYRCYSSDLTRVILSCNSSLADPYCNITQIVWGGKLKL